MNNWFVDEARVSHSWRGFELKINRIAFFPFLTGRIIEDALAGLGHPCCGCGLGRFWPVFWASRVLLMWSVRISEGHPIETLPLTSSQASAINPHVAADLADPDGMYHPLHGTDEDGNEWSDGRYVAFHCPDCHRRIPAATWPTDVQRRHANDCPAS